MPRWAYDPPAGAIVEPDSGHAEDGFASAERPPAQWINYLLHYQLAWCDYLRGPAWGQWSRAAHGGTIATLTSVTGLAVDTDDARARSQRYRYAVVGKAAGPTAKIGVSRNGLEWQDRSIPASCTALYGIARVADYWILWGDESGTKRGYSTIADDGSANSAIGTDDATKWSVVAALSEVGGVAWNGGTDAWVAMRGTAGVVGLTYTTNSAASWTTWGSQSWASGSEYGTSIAYDDSRRVYFVAGSLGAIGSWVSSSSAWTNNVGALTGIPTDADVRLVVGGPEDSRTLIAWASYRYDRTTALASTLIWRSTNGGTSWTAVTLPTGMSAITDLIHVDGVWLATSSAAPYLWRSDDDGTNWERVPLPVGDTIANWALQRAVYGDGQIVCTGLTWTVISGRASATSPGTWTSTEPGYLADAGYLRGRRIHTTAPSDGDVYSWNAATSRWEPVAASSLSVTTTRGDLIRRGASADERLALGTRGYVLRAGATDPGWSELARHGTGALPTAGADYAGTIHHDDDTKSYYVCTEDADGWDWRLVDVRKGAVITDTTSGSVTPYTLASLSIGTNRVVCVDVELLGTRDDVSGGRVLKGSASFRRDGTTTVTELEALSLLLGDPALLTINAASGAVEFEFTPPDVAAWEWKLTVRVSEITT